MDSSTPRVTYVISFCNAATREDEGGVVETTDLFRRSRQFSYSWRPARPAPYVLSVSAGRRNIRTSASE